VCVCVFVFCVCVCVCVCFLCELYCVCECEPEILMEEGLLFITAGPIPKLFAWEEGESGGHVLSKRYDEPRFMWTSWDP
jgi:hypothetical protein